MTNEPQPFDPNWIMHPGAVVLGAMCETFVKGTTLDPDVLENFVSGTQVLTDEIKEVLVKKTGVSAEFWENYERIFREGLAAGKTWLK